jgi:hypothetical protein
MRPGFRFACFTIAAFGLTASAANAQEHPYHHLHHALWELRDARKEVTEAKHDFGGHREKALVAINDAIKQLDLVLAYKGDNIKGVPTRGDLHEEYKKYKHYPHLHHALHELRHAHKQLKEAKHNFDGHRDDALRDIHFAIGQIEILLKHHKKV